MKTVSLGLLMLFMVAAGYFLAGSAHAQSTGVPRKAPVSLKTGGFKCSPAPCVLPPTQASEGGSIVTDSLIVTDPLSQKKLLLGSFDGNCPEPSALGFHLSRDGGSTWTRHCMPVIHTGGVYWPTFDPLVGYDRNGAAYIAGDYNASNSTNGFVALQKSTDGTHWSKPVIALRQPGNSFVLEAGLTVDINVGSPRVNSVYISGLIVQGPGQSKNQIVVSHSTDGGAAWAGAPVDPVQIYPEEDDFTRIAVGKDGTVYTTWMHCRGKHGGDGSGLCPTAHMMFSKSTDGGNTWSAPLEIATVKMPHYWLLPNTNQVRVYNYPVIAVDNGNGPHSGNVYVGMYTWTGTYLRVQVIRSIDDGTTWSKPVSLAPPSDTHDQFFPAISVSPTGKIGASWLDRRNDRANINYQAFAAISTDGGRTFPNTQLTKAFSNPDINGADGWMGDYTGNTWAGEDFIAAWMDSSNGVDMQEVIGGIRLK